MVSFNTCILFPLFQTVTTAALPHSQQPSFNDGDENDEYGDYLYIFFAFMLFACLHPYSFLLRVMFSFTGENVQKQKI